MTPWSKCVMGATFGGSKQQKYIPTAVQINKSVHCNYHVTV